MDAMFGTPILAASAEEMRLRCGKCLKHCHFRGIRREEGAMRCGESHVSSIRQPQLLTRKFVFKCFPAGPLGGRHQITSLLCNCSVIIIDPVLSRSSAGHVPQPLCWRAVGPLVRRCQASFVFASLSGTRADDDDDGDDIKEIACKRRHFQQLRTRLGLPTISPIPGRRRSVLVHYCATHHWLPAARICLFD